jgi:magnesium-protoporphyrin IX monomethyl ester (oxidative) cyclase
MRVLLVHPSALMHSELYLRLEPLGLERVGGAVRAAGHDVRLLDLQIFRHADYFTELGRWRPDVVAFSLNYLANVPEVLDLAKATKTQRPDCFVFAGGHSVSFVADEVLAHGDGALDCIVRGEGEEAAPLVVAASRDGDTALRGIPGVVTRAGAGPRARFIEDLDRHPPARDLTRKRRKYFIGHMDPSASIELTRGCPWDCSFCSAWTFYGRSYRKASTEAVVEEMAGIREPNVFLVDDVAFIHPEHGLEIADALERRGIRKHYYLETRADVLLRNEEVFRRWARLGLDYMFLGIEALDDEGLKAFRKRVSPHTNFKALEVARKLGIVVAINIIADPAWDEARFRHLAEWALAVPEIVHVTVQTPYPGTEIWHTESRELTTLDYRLFDVQHAVLPTAMPLARFYERLVETQSVLNRKHLGFAALREVSILSAKLALRGQTNFLRMLWKFGSVYNAERQYRDHQRPTRYKMTPPAGRRTGDELFVHGRTRDAAAATAGA